MRIEFVNREGIASLIAIISLFVIISIELTADITIQNFLLILDLLLSSFLLTEYFYRVKKNGLKYFFKTIYEPIAYLPILVYTLIIPSKYVTIARTIRILRIIGIGIRAIKGFQLWVAQITIYAFLTLLTLLMIGGITFYIVESGNNPDVNDPFDGLWWVIVTSTTVGYGDIFPITETGRMIAVFIMFTGYALIAVFTASVTGIIITTRKNFKEELLSLLSKYATKEELKEEDRRIIKEIFKILSEKT